MFCKKVHKKFNTNELQEPGQDENPENELQKKKHAPPRSRGPARTVLFSFYLYKRKQDKTTKQTAPVRNQDVFFASVAKAT